MTPAGLERYLHRHIPLSQAMQVRVREASPERVVLAAPLAPNINHRETVFGGSASALALLAAWSLLYLGLEQAGAGARLVVQRNTIDYERPIVADFSAAAARPATAAWHRFLTVLARRGRARIGVAVTLASAGETVGRLEGDFVAFAPHHALPAPHGQGPGRAQGRDQT